jgi:excisionase family DNA binding protein
MEPKIAPLPPTVEKALGDGNKLGLSVQRVAILIGVHANTVYRAASRGDIKTARIGSRVLVPVAELIRIFSPMAV